LIVTTINEDTARSVVQGICSNSRAASIARARTLRSEIAQLFADAERWNSIHVPWKGPPIDPDPDGHLRKIADDLDRMLAADLPASQMPNDLTSGD
jgi:hypothetical protein